MRPEFVSLQILFYVLSDERPTLETLDFAFHIGKFNQTFSDYIFIFLVHGSIRSCHILYIFWYYNEILGFLFTEKSVNKAVNNWYNIYI